MSRKLHAEDARVVDMLLDSGNFATDASMPQIFTNSPEMFNNRFVQVEKLLKMLDEMPAIDPPANLIANTMRRIDESVQHGIPGSAADVQPRASA